MKLHNFEEKRNKRWISIHSKKKLLKQQVGTTLIARYLESSRKLTITIGSIASCNTEISGLIVTYFPQCKATFAVDIDDISHDEEIYLSCPRYPSLILPQNDINLDEFLLKVEELALSK